MIEYGLVFGAGLVAGAFFPELHSYAMKLKAKYDFWQLTRRKD